MSGLSKFWDGYDNQPFALIEDPNQFNTTFGEDEVVGFKNVIFTGPYTVEVKCGITQFTSRLKSIRIQLTLRKIAGTI